MCFFNFSQICLVLNSFEIDFLKQILYNVNTGKLYLQKDKYMRGA